MREFCQALTTETHVTVEVLSHPEDDPSNPLTVDALLSIDGEEWALDHVRLAYEPGLIPAVKAVADKLRAALEEVLSSAESDGYLIVSYVPPGLSPTASGQGV